MHQKSKIKILAISIQILFVFISNIECPKPGFGGGDKNSENFTAFGIKQSEIGQQYFKIFTEPESDAIQWQIGAFLLDRILNQIEQNISSILQSPKSPLATSSSSSPRGRRKEKEEARKKGKVSSQIEKGKQRKDAAGEKMEGEEWDASEKRTKMEEFVKKFFQYKSAKNGINLKKPFGIEEMIGLFMPLFLDNFFAVKIMEKIGNKLKMEWNLQKEFENCKSDGENAKLIEKYIRAVVRTLHREELATLLTGTSKENGLYKGMQQMNGENNKNVDEAKIESSFVAVKTKMREIVGAEWVYKNLELLAPIIMRIDIIEPAEMMRIYRKILSYSISDEVKQNHSYLQRVTISTVFGKIWILRKQKSGMKHRLEHIWKEAKAAGTYDHDILALWIEIEEGGLVAPKKGTREDFKKYNAKKVEFTARLTEAMKNKLLELFEKFGEFKEFLDKTEGTRARILHILNLGKEIEEIFVEQRDVATILRIDPTEDRMRQLFVKNYLEAFTLNDRLEKRKALIKIFILLGVEFLNRQFAKEGEEEKLRREWTAKYRPMFFLFLDQLVDAKEQEFCDTRGTIHRNMLYILWQFMVNPNRQKHHQNLHQEVKKELKLLKQDNIGKQLLIEAKDQMKLLKKANAQIVTELVGTYPILKAIFDGKHYESNDEIFDFLIKDEEMQMSPEQLKAMEGYSSWNSNFLDIYKDYLGSELGEFKKAELNADATLWHYRKIFANLNYKTIDSGLFFKELDDLLSYYGISVAENLQGKSRKLCKMHSLFQNSLAKNEEIINLPEWGPFAVLPIFDKFTGEYCENIDYALEFAVKIVAELKNKTKIYFDYLDWLITNSVDFQQFLLKVGGDYKQRIVDILAVKKEAESMANEFEMLDKLEKKHPKCLRIDEMHKEMQLNLYKNFLQTKSYLTKSEEAERRIVISKLVAGMKKAQNASAAVGLAIDKPALFRKIQAKIDEIMEKVYANSGGSFDSMENICILIRLMQLIFLVEVEYPNGSGNIYYSIQSNGKEEQIPKYTSDICQHIESQQNAWLLQRRILQNDHIAFFNENMSTLAGTIRMFGGMTRLGLLVPRLKFDTFIERKEFAIDSNLRDHLKGAIFATNIEDELANRMAASFFSWARYLDHKLEGGGWSSEEAEDSIKRGTDQKIINEVWRSNDVRKKLIQKCDALGDTSWGTLTQMDMWLARMFSDFEDSIDEARRTVFSKEKLEELFENILSDWGRAKYDSKWPKSEWPVNLDKFHQRVGKLVGQEFIGQLDLEVDGDVQETLERHAFAVETKKFFDKGSNEIKYLDKLLGEDLEGVKKILAKLNAIANKEEIKEDEQEKETLMEEESSESKANEGEKKKDHSIEPLSGNLEDEGTSGNDKNDEILKINPEKEKNIIDSGDSASGASNNEAEKNMEKPLEGKSDKENRHLDFDGKATEEEEMKNIINIGTIQIPLNYEEMRQNEEKRKEIEEKRKAKKEKEKQSKKGRRERKQQRQNEMYHNMAQKKAKQKKSTNEEQKRQINEHLFVQELVRLLKENGYGEFTDSSAKNAMVVDNDNEGKWLAHRKKYLNQGEFAIIEIMEMLAEWNKESRILLSGSTQLKVNSDVSDIDLIVLMPYEPSKNWAKEFENLFIGNSELPCKVAEETKCANEDQKLLYCFLCKQKKIISIKKIESHIPTIKLRHSRKINFDINMALVANDALEGDHFPTIQRQLSWIKNKTLKEKMEKILEKQPTLEKIDELIRKVIAGVGEEVIKRKAEKGEESGISWEKNYGDEEELMSPQISAGVKEFKKSRGMTNKKDQDGREGMVLALSGYRANKQIAKLFGDNETEKFRNFQIATLALKLWAKNHFIYGGIFGFFNGSTLAVMVSKLALEFVKSGNDASAITLLEHFFQKYYKRENEMMEQIELDFDKNDKGIRKFLDWTLLREEAARNKNPLGWQVITAGFPTQNAAFSILPSTGHIINTELGQGLKKMDKIKKIIGLGKVVRSNDINELLGNFMLNEQKFEDKFDNFVAIVCKYSAENALGPGFCDFFELKIRLRLLDINESQIEYCHVKPERIVDEKRCPIAFRNEPIEKDTDLCVIWVAGIKLKKEPDFENIKLEAAIQWKMPLKEQITKVKNDFFAQLPRGNTLQEEKKNMDSLFRYIAGKNALLDVVKIEPDESKRN